MSKENELPEGWVWTTLNSVTSINPKIDISALPDSTLVSFIPMAAVEAGTGHIDTSIQRSLNEVKRGFTSFQEGDVLFAKITPCMENGKSAIAKSLSSGLGFGSTEFHVLRPLLGINLQLLYHFVAQESFRQTAHAHMTGSAGQLRVPSSFIADVPYPLAPTNEQDRIVSAIEQQFTRLDEGIAALRKAQAKLKRYRAAVLKAAVEGKLTEAWRAEHPTTEPASILLERILKERRTKWEGDLKAKCKDPAKVKYVEPAKPEVEGLPELPDGWCWATIDQIGEVGTGATPLRSHKRYYDGGTIPWVTSGALNSETITTAEEYITQQALTETNAKVFPKGTLLLAMYGEGKTRGKVAELQIDAATNQACAAIVLSGSSKICQSYVKYFLLSNYDDIRRLSSGGVQPNLNLLKVKRTVIPLPSVIEQEQIVTGVEQSLSIVTQLETIVEANLKRAERLRQSILKEAFAGRLIPQHPDDEPASILLERIHKEREERKKGIVGNGRYAKASSEPVKIDVEDTQQVGLWEGVRG